MCAQKASVAVHFDPTMRLKFCRSSEKSRIIERMRIAKMELAGTGHSIRVFHTRWPQGRRHRQRHERGRCRRTVHEERQRIALALRRTARREAETDDLLHAPRGFACRGVEARLRGRLDYLLLESTGTSEPLPAEPRLGRRTTLTFPLFCPPQKNRSPPSNSSPEISTP